MLRRPLEPKLHPAVRMVGEPRRGTLARDGHVERSERELVAEVVGHGPADDAAGEQVEHHGQVQPALSSPDVGQILSAKSGRLSQCRKARDACFCMRHSR